MEFKKLDWMQNNSSASETKLADVTVTLELVLKTVGSMGEIFETSIPAISLEKPKELFFNNVKTSSQSAFRQTLSLKGMSADEEVKSAIYLVAFCSMSVLLEHVEASFGEKTSHHVNITMICCLLLRKGNWYLVLSVISKESSEFLESKLNAMKNFLLSQSKEHQDNEKKLKLLKACANHLGLSFKSKKLRASRTSGEQRIFPSQDSNNKQEIEIFHDGRIYTGNRDPPGQRSVYIHPGDGAKESYRLSTFLKFPLVAPVDPRLLAEAGFLFTGYRDRVKCFSCGINVYDWSIGDDVKSARWHRSDCRMARGEDELNVPLIGRMFKSLLLQSQNRSQDSTFSQQAISAVAVPSCGRPCRSDDLTNNVAMASSAQPVTSTSLKKVEPGPQTSQNFNTVFRFATISSRFYEDFLRSLDLRKEENRLKTFKNWTVKPSCVSPHHLAKSGFFYLGNLDRVQCFSCQEVAKNWKSSDNAEEEHRNLFPRCRMVLKTETRNVPLSNSMNSPSDGSATNSQSYSLTEAEIVNLQSMFPCQHAVNPHMRSEASRCDTFDSRWKQISMNVTPRLLAQAGFFFLGDRDRVKCWYCNGGLQNWERNENPWTEHAKWFPMCEFLLQLKGPDFVHSIVSAFPSLPRPTVSGQSNGQSQNGVQRSRLPSPPPPIVDPQAEKVAMKKRLNEAMVSKVVKEVEEMGFDKKSIFVCIKRRLKTNSNTMYGSASEMVEILLNGDSSMEDSDESDSEMETVHFCQAPVAVNTATPLPSAIEQGTSSSVAHEPMSPESSRILQKQIKELREQRRCKICLDSMADVVFTPCGHLCSCMTCAPALKQCPICRMKIAKAIRTYQS